MKMLLSALLITGVTIAHAAPYKRPVLKQYTPEERAEMVARNGGYVKPKTNGKSVLLVDARGVDDNLASNFVKRLRMTLQLPFTIEKKALPNDPLCKVGRSLKSEKHPAVVMIVDRKDDTPGLGAFPEEAVSFVNVSRYKTDDVKKYTERLGKELWRATGLAVGGYGIMQPGCVLTPVFSPEELDEMHGVILSPLRYNSIYKTMNSLDLMKDKEALYSSAVRQGWAPPPTNDVQKAIWDRIKAQAQKRAGAK